MKRLHSTRCAAVLWWIGLAVLVAAHPARGQGENSCNLLCSPELKIEPTVTFENFAARPRVVTFENGQPVDTSAVAPEQTFEMIFALDVPTAIPRLGLTLEAIWTPLAKTDENLFTGRNASQLGRKVTDNPVELEAELNLTLLRAEDTGGWAEVHFDIIDKFSPAEDPDATGLYTHKLNLELDAGFAVLKWLPEENWLRNVELEGSLDYVATGLPDAGDRIGDELFLERASPWSFSVVLVLLAAPL